MMARSDRRRRQIVRRADRKSLGRKVGSWPDDERRLMARLDALRTKMQHDGWNDDTAHEIRRIELDIHKGRAAWEELKALNSTLPYDWMVKRSWMGGNCA